MAPHHRWIFGKNVLVATKIANFATPFSSQLIFIVVSLYLSKKSSIFALLTLASHPQGSNEHLLHFSTEKQQFVKYPIHHHHKYNNMLIDIKGININIDNRKILENVHFRVDENEFVYIIGRVGSGKSSLLKTIYAEREFEGGEAHVMGFDLSKLRTKHIPELRRQMGFVFQDFALLQRHTVAQNLDFVLRATDWKKQTDREARIDEVLAQVEMTDKKHSYPHQLSGGEQQHIAIARALLNKPRLILADEPTGNLDSETGERIVQLLRSLTEQHTAVVMVTHNRQYLNQFPGIVYGCSEGCIHDITNDFAL